jgi:hypothetical protein
MVKISHEVPKCLLKESLNFNDYQYALVHLLETDEEYKNHFIKCRDEGVEIYLDNSLHELGTAIGGEILLKWINILKPSNAFIPDVWGDVNMSIKNAKEWSNIYVPKETTKVAIIQAKSLPEAATCYNTYKDLGYKKIAFPYGANYYLNHFSHQNKDIARALGRVEVISRLYEHKVMEYTDEIHLLGTSCSFEFSLYKYMPLLKIIKSIDTSNPIMLALDKEKYNVLCTNNKPLSNMNNNFNIKYSEIDQNILYYNIHKFKQILK